MKTKIVWNGCDSYVELDQASFRGHNVVGEKLFHGAHEFTAFEAEEIDPETLPKDADGDANFDGIFGTETGKFYK